MILILGSTGYIGWNIASELAKARKSFLEMPRWRVDYYDSEKLSQLILSNNIKTIINSTGFVPDSFCAKNKEDKEECYTANIEFPTNLARVCCLLNVKLIHVSDAGIFNGNQKLYTEEDHPNRCDEDLNYYYFCKYLAETRVSAFLPSNHYILRCYLPFSNEHKEKNLISKVLKQDSILTCNTSATRLDDFTRAILHFVNTEQRAGVYNVVNSGFFSRSLIVEEFKRNNKEVDKQYSFYDNENDFKMIGQKDSSYCTIDNKKLIDTGFEMPDVQDAIKSCIKSFKMT